MELSIWRTKAFCPPQVRPHLWHRSLCLVELKSPEGWKKGPLRANRPCPHQFPKTSFLPCNTSLNHVSRVPLLHPTPCRAAGQLSDLLLGTQSWALEELLAPLKASAALESPNAEWPHLYLTQQGTSNQKSMSCPQGQEKDWRRSPAAKVFNVPLSMSLPVGTDPSKVGMAPKASRGDGGQPATAWELILSPRKQSRVTRPVKPLPGSAAWCCTALWA